MAVTQTYTRASRDYEYVAAQGGSMQVFRYDMAGNLTAGVLLDIREWITIETYRNQNTTNSGSNGADQFTRVGSGWVFAATLSFPGRLPDVEGVTEGGLATQFVDQLLGSMKSVGLIFNCGDPLWWEARGLPALTYRASHALLEEVKTVCTPNTEGGGKVIQLNVSGVGNSFLNKYVGNQQQHPSLWQ